MFCLFIVECCLLTIFCWEALRESFKSFGFACEPLDKFEQPCARLDCNCRILRTLHEFVEMWPRLVRLVLLNGLKKETSFISSQSCLFLMDGIRYYVWSKCCHLCFKQFGLGLSLLFLRWFFMKIIHQLTQIKGILALNYLKS